MSDVVRPFRVAVPEEDLVDLRRRLRSGRWPEEQPVLGWAQGVPLRYLRELCDFWADSTGSAASHRLPAGVSTGSRERGSS